MLKFSAFSIILLAALSLSACESDGFPYSEVETLRCINLSPVGPPPPIEEKAERPADPTTEIWRPGYWIYNGTAFSWVHGALMPRPSSTAVWAADYWMQHDYGWAYVAGHWQ